jgi:hypothetical protein
VDKEGDGDRQQHEAVEDHQQGADELHDRILPASSDQSPPRG